MRIWLAVFIFLLGGCLNTDNSSSQDAGFAPDDASTPEFQAARAVMAQLCANCHNYHTQSEAQLIAAHLIIAGDPDNSLIYGRLQNSTGAIPDKTMPKDNSISAEDLETIKTWITNIQ